MLLESFVFSHPIKTLYRYREIGNILWRYNIIYSRPDIKNDNITSIIKQPSINHCVLVFIYNRKIGVANMALN